MYCVIVCVCITPKSEWNSVSARVHNYMPRLGGGVGSDNPVASYWVMGLTGHAKWGDW